jgi:hypothetical protein
MKQTGFFLRSNWSTIVIGVAAISAGAAAVEFKSQIVNSIAAQGVSLSASLIASNLLVTFLPALVISLANNNLRRNIISGLSTISIFAVGLWKMTSMEFSKEENEYVKNIWDRKNQDLTTEIILSRRSVMTKFLPAIVLGFASLLAMNFMRAFANAAAPAQAQAQAQVDNVPARPAVEPHETSTFSQGRRRKSSLSSARPTVLPNAPVPEGQANSAHAPLVSPESGRMGRSRARRGVEANSSAQPPLLELLSPGLSPEVGGLPTSHAGAVSEERSQRKHRGL